MFMCFRENQCFLHVLVNIGTSFIYRDLGVANETEVYYTA